MQHVESPADVRRPARRTAVERAAARLDPEAKYNEHMRKVTARRRAAAKAKLPGDFAPWVRPDEIWRTALVPRDSALGVYIEGEEV
jgi:hypothetical protein